MPEFRELMVFTHKFAGIQALLKIFVPEALLSFSAHGRPHATLMVYISCLPGYLTSFLPSGLNPANRGIFADGTTKDYRYR